MSPMIQARLQRFRQNRLGYFCFILFSLIIVLDRMHRVPPPQYILIVTTQWPK